MQLHTGNSITDESGSVFIAESLKEGKSELEETENIELRKLPFGDALGMIERGETTDTISVAALLAVVRRLSALTGAILLAIALCVAPPAGADDFPEFNRDPARARIVTDDLERFWAAWDLAERNPGQRRAIFQREYLDAGSHGLKGFVEVRIENVDKLLAAIDRNPRYYASLRTLTSKMAAAAEPALAAMRDLHALLPEAVFPDTYLMIGRMNTGGTIHWNGLLIGAEMYGLTPDTPTDELGAWHRAVIRHRDDLPVIIIHELIHIQQAKFSRTAPANVLAQAIHEGAADFLTELILGRHINVHVHEWALPREAELWLEFREIMHGKDSEDWLYGGDSAGEGRPADLGYFIGYRIAQAYYDQVEDKRAAIRDIVATTDPAAFLEASGYEQRQQPPY